MKRTPTLHMAIFPLLLSLLALIACATPDADDLPTEVGPLQLERVDEGVYALIGSIDARSAENLALNANYGIVVGDDGVLVIDAGASPAGARVIEEAVARVTDRPIRWVMNTGSQDHRWLGNSHFAEQGVEIIALERTAETQEGFIDNHLERLSGALPSDEIERIRPLTAEDPVADDAYELDIGGQSVELRYFGDSHFPGDAVVWLPERQVLFSGDLVYVDRLLGIHPWTDVESKRDAFNAVMAAYDPAIIVPGHGQVTDQAGARAATGDYLDLLVDGVAADARDWVPMEEVMERYREPEAFRELEHFDDWHPRNINRVYLEFEG